MNSALCWLACEVLGHWDGEPGPTHSFNKVEGVLLLLLQSCPTLCNPIDGSLILTSSGDDGHGYGNRLILILDICTKEKNTEEKHRWE